MGVQRPRVKCVPGLTMGQCELSLRYYKCYVHIIDINKVNVSRMRWLVSRD